MNTTRDTGKMASLYGIGALESPIQSSTSGSDIAQEGVQVEDRRRQDKSLSYILHVTDDRKQEISKSRFNLLIQKLCLNDLGSGIWVIIFDNLTNAED